MRSGRFAANAKADSSLRRPGESMTPRERFMAGILGKPVDRRPVGSPTSVATVEQMESTGACFPEVHQDGEAMARLAAGSYEVLGYDAIMPIFSVQQEAAACGAEAGPRRAGSERAGAATPSAFATSRRRPSPCPRSDRRPDRRRCR